MTMSISEFFSLVLPERGKYCIQGLTPTSNKQYFCNTQEEAEARAEELIQQQYNVYFACSKFKSNLRNNKNIECIRVFFLDIDCGKGKPYPDHISGATAGVAFCKSVGLPAPTIINSGNGLHLYWVMDRDLSAAEWKPLAEALKGLCIKSKFDADHAVTADLSRIMRLPGSQNHKVSPPLETEVLSVAAVQEFESFRTILGAAPILPKLEVVGEEGLIEVGAEPPEHIPRGLSPLMLRKVDQTHKLFSKILQSGCAQLDRIVLDQATIPEPEWRAGLSIARNCSDWEQYIHVISEGHPGYDADKTETKAAETLDKPYTCDTFAKLVPNLCDNCVHKGKIKSPIQLGMELIVAESSELIVMDGDTPVVYTVPDMPPGYSRLHNGGIFYTDKDDHEIIVYEHDIYLVKRMRDNTRGDLVLCRLHLPLEKVREFVIPLTYLSNNEKLRELLASNGVIGAAKQMERITAYLIISAKYHQTLMNLEILHPQFGWANNDTSFILGDREITATEIRYSPPSEITESLAKLIYSKGDLSEWRRVIETYNRPGFEPQAFALLAGIGALMMKFSGHRGAFVNVMHGDSGTGKTTTQKSVNSFFGHPTNLLSKETDTLAYKLHLMGVFNNLPVCYDELTNITPVNTSILLYAASQGQGPARMQGSANIARKNETSWATIAIGSSNSSLVQKLHSIKAATNGEVMRLLEYTMPPTGILSKAEAYELYEQTLHNNFGMALPILIQALLQDLPKEIAALGKIQARFDADASLQSRDRFHSAVISNGLFIGYKCREIDLFTFDMERHEEWARQTLLPQIHGAIREMDDVYMDVLGLFIHKHMSHILIIDGVLEAGSPRGRLADRFPTNELIIRLEPDTKLMYIASKPFRDHCTMEQMVCRDLLEDLKRKGIYLGEKRVRLSSGTNVVSPPIWCLKFAYQEDDSYLSGINLG